MTKPVCSIIIPAYNEERNIKACIHSLLNQDFKDFELIVIDNNSTDNTKKIIKDVQQKDKRVKYIFEKVRKRGAARFAGEQKAKGDIIVMSDADSLFPRNWLKELIKPILEKKAMAVQGVEAVHSTSFVARTIEKEMFAKWSKAKITTKGFLLNTIGNVDTKNFAITRAKLKEIGFTSPKYKSGNDTDISLKLHLAKTKVYLNKKAVVTHETSSRLFKTAKKYRVRGYWCHLITKDYAHKLNLEKFKKDTNQKANFNLLRGLNRMSKKGLKENLLLFFLDCSWRLGIFLAKRK